MRDKPYSYCFIQNGSTLGFEGNMKAEDDGKFVEVCVQRHIVSSTGEEFYTIAYFYLTGNVYFPSSKYKYNTCEEAQESLDAIAALYKWEPFNPESIM